jgi:RHS repeat-associated protein
MVNGTATGTAITRYIHPDNLGSTNVTSDAGGNLAQWFNYAPYGSVLASDNTGTTTAARQYIGQFYDASGLSYLNARYYNGAQGQFTSEDPTFLDGPSQQNLQDPQSMNAYSYSEDDPIIKEDPNGKCPWYLIPIATALGAAGGLTEQGLTDVATNYISHGTDVQDYTWSPAKDYLYSAGAGAALGFALSGGAALELGAGSIAAIAGGGTVASDVVRDKYIDQEAINPWEVAADGLISAGTAGLIGSTPGVPGALPNLFTDAFYTGSHTANEALQTGVSTLSAGFASAIFNNASTIQSRQNAVSSYNAAIGGVSSGGGGGGGSSPNTNSLWVTPSGAVVNWGGQLISGPTSSR